MCLYCPMEGDQIFSLYLSETNFKLVSIFCMSKITFAHLPSHVGALMEHQQRIWDNYQGKLYLEVPCFKF
jgi:hypothetical protein